MNTLYEYLNFIGYFFQLGLHLKDPTEHKSIKPLKLYVKVLLSLFLNVFTLFTFKFMDWISPISNNPSFTTPRGALTFVMMLSVYLFFIAGGAWIIGFVGYLFSRNH